MKIKLMKNQKGLTLVELLISMVMGLFLMAGVIQILSGVRQTSLMNENLSKLQENGRFAMDFLSRDIRMADFAGCLDGGLSRATNNLDASDGEFDAALHTFSFGTEGVEGGGNAPDALLIKGGSNGVELSSDGGIRGRLELAATGHFKRGDIALITNCTAGDIFQVNNLSSSTTNRVKHKTGGGISPGNFNVTNPACGGTRGHCFSSAYNKDTSVLYKLKAISYSIKAGSKSPLSLFRQENGGTDIELIEGVENMQILYGEDTDGDLTANYYVPAGSAGLNMKQVVSLRISLLLHTESDNIAPEPQTYNYNGAAVTATDNRIRRVFQSTIAVRNHIS